MGGCQGGEKEKFVSSTGPRDLLHAPLCRAEDLGCPIPDSPHATSVAMPLWRHVIGYEEGDPEIVNRLACGYPRFVVHPRVRDLFQACLERSGRKGETCFAFPSERLAKECVAFLHEQEVPSARLAAQPGGVYAALFPEAAFPHAKRFWQHFGGIVSSRLAEAALGHRDEDPVNIEADRILRDRIARLAGCRAETIFLYPTGMAALAASLAMVQELRPGAKSIQLGFPYVDGLKIQTVRGPGAHFFPTAGTEDLETIARLVRDESISGLFCELPGNPMLRSADIPALSAILRPAGVPLIVDDTVATFENVDVLPWADIVVSSLTKSFSGVGDVMAGSLILSESSSYFGRFVQWQTRHYENLLWHEDAAVLERNSRDFPERQRRMNENALALCQWLRERPEVETVYYPHFEAKDHYDKVRKAEGGYGGLFSILLRDGVHRSAPFYDALEITKGPSLGMNYSLACPYTLLAHYTELEWAESLGIPAHLIRVSVGIEPVDELKARFERAFAASEQG